MNNGIYSSAVHNCTDLETAQRLLTELWVNKLRDSHTMTQRNIIEQSKQMNHSHMQHNA